MTQEADRGSHDPATPTSAGRRGQEGPVRPPLHVLTTAHGTPDRVLWDDIEYLCGDIPLEWIWHTAWWRAESVDPGGIDIIAWRLRLIPLPGQRTRRERCIDATRRTDGTWEVLEEIFPEGPLA
ncbi:hypothetical protein JT358_01095 [Micrococcales bacterium 31B]|nr:hypothetical protein [Micrococcales bacterium 31B]